jgi:hypothetical protein
MTKNERAADAQAKVAESELDESRLDRFNHPLFREAPPDYKPLPIESICHCFHGFGRVIIKYTICLPITLAEKFNWCGCGEILGDDMIKIFVTSFVENVIKTTTGKPNDIARKYTGMAFQAGCWDGPALVNAIAPIINSVINKKWHDLEASAYVRQDMRSEIPTQFSKRSRVHP